MWREVNPYNHYDLNVPPEGETVMTTDGKSVAPLWYLYSSEYRWVNYSDDLDCEASLPFNPTHWMPMNEYTQYLRGEKLNKILDESR